jgi:hypothetical protein
MPLLPFYLPTLTTSKTPTFYQTYLLTYLPNRLYIHTYHSRFISEGVAEGSQILLQDAHVLPKLLSYEEYNSRDSW